MKKCCSGLLECYVIFSFSVGIFFLFMFSCKWDFVLEGYFFTVLFFSVGIFSVFMYFAKSNEC